MASAGPANPEQVAVKVKTLINNQLKQILKREGLPVSGAKATLQSRITERGLSFDSLLPTCCRTILLVLHKHFVQNTHVVSHGRPHELTALGAMQNCSPTLAPTILKGSVV